jgi:2-keto-4-pentenoate hydratase/2-oxohepta-3-ene-1,7-dioic acid hydratase in catechol pathway
MKIAQFSINETHAIGVDCAGTWINYTDALIAYAWLVTKQPARRFSTIGHLIAAQRCDGAEIAAVVKFVKAHSLMRHLSVPASAVMMAPIASPAKIIALGLNYRLHAKEGHFDVPTEPILFMKAGSSVIGPGDAIRIPRDRGRIDHEVELAVIIGRTASRVKKKDAYKYIAGYSIINDVTAREVQTKDIANKHPWFRSKSFDTFTPFGPWIVTPDSIAPPVHLAIECRVNGTIRQKSNTKQLVFDIPTLIEFITRDITLEPCDVISTGTPHGIDEIKHGDVVTCRIAGIGELTNPVRRK